MLVPFHSSDWVKKDRPLRPRLTLPAVASIFTTELGDPTADRVDGTDNR